LQLYHGAVDTNQPARTTLPVPRPRWKLGFVVGNGISPALLDPELSEAVPLVPLNRLLQPGLEPCGLVGDPTAPGLALPDLKLLSKSAEQVRLLGGGGVESVPVDELVEEVVDVLRQLAHLLHPAPGRRREALHLRRLHQVHVHQFLEAVLEEANLVLLTSG
jgi:hypothetical protein